MPCADVQYPVVNGKYPKNPPGDGAPPSREVAAEPEQVVADPVKVVAEPEQVVADPEQEPEQVAAEPNQVAAEPDEVVAEPEAAGIAPWPCHLCKFVNRYNHCSNPRFCGVVNEKYPKNPPGDGAPPSREVAAEPEQVVAVPDQKKAAAAAAAQSQAQAVAASSSSEGQVVADPDQVAKPAQVVADPKLVVATPERMVTSPEHVVAELDQVAAELDQVVAEPGQDVAKPEQKKAAAVAAVQLQAQAATASSSSEASSSSSSSAAAASIAHSEATERNFVYIGMQLKCMNPFTDQYITVTVKRFAEEAFDDNCSGIVTDLGDPIDKHDQVMVMHPGKTPYRACAGDLVQVDRPWDVGPGAVVQEHTEPDAEVVREIPKADFGAVPLNAAAEAIKLLNLKKKWSSRTRRRAILVPVT